MKSSSVSRLLISLAIVAIVASAFTIGPAFAKGLGNDRAQENQATAQSRPEDAPGHNKVVVCHNVGTDEQTEVRVPEHSAVATKHVESGRAILGPCPLPYP